MQTVPVSPESVPARRRVGASRTGRPNKVTRSIRDAIWAAVEQAGDELLAAGKVTGCEGGATAYLAWLSIAHATEFAYLLGRTLPRDATTNDQPVTFVVHQLAVPASPIAGITNSPIAAHVAAPRLAANHGEVIEAT